jgi:hypothetical protein
MAFPNQPGTPSSLGTSSLDAPPPSPTPMGGGGAPPFSPQGLAGAPPVPTDQMPPEVLTGIMQAAQTISATLDSFAQVTPDKGAQLGLIKDLLQRYLADIMAAGSGPVSATAPGPAFPGGGIDRGIAGPGSV